MTTKAEHNRKMLEPPKSELAIKRDEWFKTEDGQKCCDPFTLKQGREGGRYLHNRLERAFLAGAKATNDIAEDLANKITEEK